MADEREKYAQYPHTILEFSPPGGARVDLRRPVDGAARAALAQAFTLDPFAVLTAENPEGENADDAPRPDAEARERAANDRRTRGLVATLEACGLPFVRVDGTAPDGGYRERCVAMRASLAEARALATDARQLALFWFDGERFWLIPAEADAAPRALPADDDAPKRTRR